MPYVAKPPEERFWPKVERCPDGCWRWTGALLRGYGKFYANPVDRPFVYAHRFAYELLVGPIPDGLQLDHLCRNRACVNPEHLEPVTAAENLRRSRAIRTHCKNGHDVTEGGECITCRRARVRRSRERRRALQS